MPMQCDVESRISTDLATEYCKKTPCKIATQIQFAFLVFDYIISMVGKKFVEESADCKWTLSFESTLEK